MSILSLANLVLALVGVGLIVKPTFIFRDEHSPSHNSLKYPYAATSAVLSAIIQGAVFVQLSLLKEAHFSVVLSLFGVATCAASAITAAVVPPFFGGGSLLLPSWMDLGLVAAISLLVSGSQVALTLALQIETAAMAALIIKTSFVLLALIFQVLWFQVGSFFQENFLCVCV